MIMTSPSRPAEKITLRGEGESSILGRTETNDGSKGLSVSSEDRGVKSSSWAQTLRLQLLQSPAPVDNVESSIFAVATSTVFPQPPPIPCSAGEMAVENTNTEARSSHGKTFLGSSDPRQNPSLMSLLIEAKPEVEQSNCESGGILESLRKISSHHVDTGAVGMGKSCNDLLFAASSKVLTTSHLECCGHRGVPSRRDCGRKCGHKTRTKQSRRSQSLQSLIDDLWNTVPECDDISESRKVPKDIILALTYKHVKRLQRLLSSCVQQHSDVSDSLTSAHFPPSEDLPCQAVSWLHSTGNSVDVDSSGALCHDIASSTASFDDSAIQLCTGDLTGSWMSEGSQTNVEVDISCDLSASPGAGTRSSQSSTVACGNLPTREEFTGVSGLCQASDDPALPVDSVFDTDTIADSSSSFLIDIFDADQSCASFDDAEGDESFQVRNTC